MFRKITDYRVADAIKVIELCITLLNKASDTLRDSFNS